MSGAIVDYYGQTMLEPDTREYFGGRAWFNYGLWPATTPAAASDALFASTLEAVPFVPRSVVDVGCGLGEGCALLTQRWPMARVIGVNISEPQLVAARARAPHAEFLLADGSALPIADGAVDVVIAIESVFHVRPRTAFFREAWRILRPGGVLSVADLLVGLMTQEPWMSLWPPVNVVGGPAVYADQLRAAGFAGVDVTDVTARTIVPTVLYRIARVHRLAAAGAISAADHAQRMTRLASIGRIFPGYVLATARKPEAA